MPKKITMVVVVHGKNKSHASAGSTRKLVFMTLSFNFVKEILKKLYISVN